MTPAPSPGPHFLPLSSSAPRLAAWSLPSVSGLCLSVSPSPLGSSLLPLPSPITEPGATPLGVLILSALSPPRGPTLAGLMQEPLLALSRDNRGSWPRAGSLRPQRPSPASFCFGGDTNINRRLGLDQDSLGHLCSRPHHSREGRGRGALGSSAVEEPESQKRLEAGGNRSQPRPPARVRLLLAGRLRLARSPTSELLPHAREEPPGRPQWPNERGASWFPALDGGPARFLKGTPCLPPLRGWGRGPEGQADGGVSPGGDWPGCSGSQGVLPGGGGAGCLEAHQKLTSRGARNSNPAPKTTKRGDVGRSPG